MIRLLMVGEEVKNGQHTSEVLMRLSMFALKSSHDFAFAPKLHNGWLTKFCCRYAAAAEPYALAHVPPTTIHM